MTFRRFFVLLICCSLALLNLSAQVDTLAPTVRTISPSDSGVIVLQTTVKQSGLIKIGLGMTGNYYMGDLSTSEFAYNRIYPGAELFFSSDVPHRVKWILHAGFANFTEQNDKPQYTQTFSPDLRPNTYVSTNFAYGDIGIQVRAFKKHRFQPYLSAGAGVLFFSPKDKRNSGLLDQDFSRLETETYSLIALQAPLGFGFEYKISPILGINLQYSYRFTSSDYLDNIGKLGVVKGNDRLQNIQLGLTFAPVPAQESYNMFVPKVRKVKKIKDVVVVPVDSSLDTILFPVQVPTEADYEDMLNSGKEIIFEIGEGLLKQDEPQPETPKKEPQIQSQPIQDESFPDDSESDELAWLWKYLEDDAIKKGEYILYTCNPGETYSSLYERFRVGAKSIRRINNIKTGVLPPNDVPLKIPDTRKWMALFPDIERIIEESGATPP